MKKNYKIKLICLLCAFTALSSNCKKGETIEEQGLSGKHGEMAYAGDKEYDVLGYGYDVTERFANSESSRLPVLETKKYALENPGLYLPNDHVDQYFQYTFGENATSYSDKLTQSYKATADLGLAKTIKLFKAEVNFSFAKKDSASSKYVYGTVRKMIKQRSMQLFYTIETLANKYLTAQFKSDVQTLAPEILIQRYGTHVLTDIELGARLDINYEAQTNYSKREESAKYGVDVTAWKVFSVKADIGTNNVEANSNFNQTLYYSTVGGDGTKGLNGELSLDNSAPKISIASWQSSCTRENAALIKIGRDGLIPLEDLITDPVKKQQIKNAIEKYIRDSQFKLVADGLKYGIYKVTNITSSQALTIPNYKGSSYKNGTDACQWPWYDGSEQKWSVQKIGDGTYKMTNLKSNQVLTIPNYSGSSYKNGTDACQWPWYDGNEQKWSLEKIGDNTYKVINGKSNQVLTIPNYNNSASLYKNGTNACQWSWYGGNEQKWKFELLQEL